MAQLQSPIVIDGHFLPSFTPQMLTNVHAMLVPITRAWMVCLVWASTDIFHFHIIQLVAIPKRYPHFSVHTLHIKG
jgi:hypothetical protein